METILSIDNGTQSIRAMLFNAKGDLLYKAKVEIEPYFSKHPGWAEQEPEYFWKNLCLACQKLWQLCGKEKSSIDTWRGTYRNV